MHVPLRQKLAAEAIGAFCLVFAGTGAIVVNGSEAGSHIAVALTFGLIVFAMIAALGDNPRRTSIRRSRSAFISRAAFRAEPCSRTSSLNAAGP